jgi:hypothetical protein
MKTLIVSVCVTTALVLAGLGWDLSTISAQQGRRPVLPELVDGTTVMSASWYHDSDDEGPLPPTCITIAVEAKPGEEPQETARRFKDAITVAVAVKPPNDAELGGPAALERP